MADKKKRSLREAFGVVRPSEGTTVPEAPKEDAPAAAGPVGAPNGGKPASGGKENPEGAAPRRRRRASSNGNGSNSESRTGRGSTKAIATGDPVNTAGRSGAGGKGRGRAAAGAEGPDESGEMVPGKGGKMVPAETPVNMTFTVTAKERYLWTLELKRRGLTAVGVLRETMEGMVGEDHG